MRWDDFRQRRMELGWQTHLDQSKRAQDRQGGHCPYQAAKRTRCQQASRLLP
jgi:hypothetical protein